LLTNEQLQNYLLNSFKVQDTIDSLSGQNDSEDSINLLFWNLRGRDNLIFFNEMRNKYNIDIANLVETYYKNDLNIFEYETTNPSKDPIQTHDGQQIYGRDSGGIYIGSNLPSCKPSFGDG